MSTEALRMIERIIGVLIGGLSIFLGFQLFKAVPHITTGEGKFEFPGGSVHLFRTGPGVFFALFGCAIIYWSFSHPIAVGGPATDGSNVFTQDSIQNWQFLGSSGRLSEAQYRIWIQNMNRIDQALRSDTSKITNEEAANTISQLKIFVIQHMYDDPSSLEFKKFSVKLMANSKQKFEKGWQKWADLYNVQ